MSKKIAFCSLRVFKVEIKVQSWNFSDIKPEHKWSRRLLSLISSVGVPGLAMWAAQVEGEPKPWEPHPVGEPVHHPKVPGLAAGRQRPGLWGGVEAAAQRTAPHGPAHPRAAGKGVSVPRWQKAIWACFTNLCFFLEVRKRESRRRKELVWSHHLLLSASLLVVMFVSHKSLKIEVVNDQPTHFLLNTPPSHPLPKTSMFPRLALTSILFSYTACNYWSREKKGIAIIFI